MIDLDKQQKKVNIEKTIYKYDNNEKGYILDSIIESDNIIFKLVVSVFCIAYTFGIIYLSILGIKGYYEKNILENVYSLNKILACHPAIWYIIDTIFVIALFMLLKAIWNKKSKNELNDYVLKKIRKTYIKCENENIHNLGCSLSVFIYFIAFCCFIASIFYFFKYNLNSRHSLNPYSVYFFCSILICMLILKFSNNYMSKRNITSIRIPPKYKLINKKEYQITSIGKDLFKNCKNLKTVLVPDSITKIGDNAFYGCTNLIILTIPDSVTEIGKNAFYSVKNVFYKGSAKGSPWGAEKISDPNPNNESSIYIIDKK